MKTDLSRRAVPAGPNEMAASPGHGGREPGGWRRTWRRLMPPPSAELMRAQLSRQLAVLEGARTELEAGWVQGGWWTVCSGDGSYRLVCGVPAAAGPPAHVGGACLVGALVRAGSHPPGAESDVGRAVDAVYDALWASRGQPGVPPPAGQPPALPPAPPPAVRLARVRTLTQWNDTAERTRADVLALVDRAISATIMGLCQPEVISPGRDAVPAR